MDLETVFYLPIILAANFPFATFVIFFFWWMFFEWKREQREIEDSARY